MNEMSISRHKSTNSSFIMSDSSFHSLSDIVHELELVNFFASYLVMTRQNYLGKKLVHFSVEIDSTNFVLPLYMLLLLLRN